MGIQPAHPLIQGAMKPEISAAQSGGDNNSPMQSPVIATTSGHCDDKKKVLWCCYPLVMTNTAMV